ncbi:MAG TPA: hypothetical protein VN843_12370 [Anaerolineales bacterium]|nr:hypothetical protein [Anaerolineales bacterium]
MKLENFDKVGRGTRTRYISKVKDVAGSEDYEFVVAGSDVRIKKILKDIDFDMKIDPKATEDDWKEIQQILWEERKTTLSSLASLENLSNLFKRQPSNPTIDNSVFMSLRRIRGEGTLYRFLFGPFGLARGISVFLTLPSVCSCYCIARPSSGDTDLFLSINSPMAIPVRSSALGGTALDSIVYPPGLGFPCWPWTTFTPFFRVFGYTATVVSLEWGGIGWP